MSGPRIVIAAGGTAGHVVPAIAVADALRAEGAEVSLRRRPAGGGGARPAAGYPLDPIRVEGISRSQPAEGRRAPSARPALALRDAARDPARAARPTPCSAAAATSPGPSALAAVAAPHPARAHRGRLAHGPDQPAARRPRARASASPSRSPAATASATCVTGRPVPPRVADRASGPRRARASAPDERCVLVFGGSLGARSINEAAVAAFAGRALPRPAHRRPARLPRPRPRPGRTTTCATTSTPFGPALAAADLAVARAGGSIFELAQYGLPAVLVPYPHATADHQTANARWMEQGGAAIVIADAELTPERPARRRRRDPARRGAAARRWPPPSRAARPAGRGRGRRPRGARSQRADRSPRVGTPFVQSRPGGSSPGAREPLREQ